MNYNTITIFAAVILAIISVVFTGLPGPADWLVDWTNWAAAFFGISFGGRALWHGSTWLKNHS